MLAAFPILNFPNKNATAGDPAFFQILEQLIGSIERSFVDWNSRQFSGFGKLKELTEFGKASNE
jgi:hypothetical protein